MIKTYEDWKNSLDQNYVRQLSPDAWDLTGSAFEAGQESQQAKIDAITKQRGSFIKAYHIAMNDVCEHKAKIDELQTRIDEALKHLDLAYPESWGYCVDQAIDILKGNKDEN